MTPACPAPAAACRYSPAPSVHRLGAWCRSPAHPVGRPRAGARSSMSEPLRTGVDQPSLAHPVRLQLGLDQIAADQIGGADQDRAARGPEQQARDLVQRPEGAGRDRAGDHPGEQLQGQQRHEEHADHRKPCRPVHRPPPRAGSAASRRAAPGTPRRAAPTQLARPRISRHGAARERRQRREPDHRQHDDVEQGQLHAAHRSDRRSTATQGAAHPSRRRGRSSASAPRPPGSRPNPCPCAA